jgi:hypothetical protein
LLLHCRAGLTLAEGSLCFEATQTAATSWSSAWLRCFNLGLRLPALSELGPVYRAIATPTIDENNWTDEATGASSHFALHVVGFTLGIENHADSVSIGSRCVTTAHNNLGPAPTIAAASQASTRANKQVRTPTFRKVRARTSSR